MSNSTLAKTGNLPYCHHEKVGDLVAQTEDGDYHPLPETQRKNYSKHIMTYPHNQLIFANSRSQRRSRVDTTGIN